MMEPHLIVKVFFKPGEAAAFESFAYSPNEEIAYGSVAQKWAIEQAVLKHPHATKVRVYRPIGQAEVHATTEVHIDWEVELTD